MWSADGWDGARSARYNPTPWLASLSLTEHGDTNSHMFIASAYQPFIVSSLSSTLHIDQDWSEQEKK